MRERAQEDAPLAPLTREALGWIAHLSSGEATVDDADALARWRAGSNAHETAFREALIFRHAITDVGQAMLAEREAAGVATLRSRTAPINRRSFLVGGGSAVAASLAGAWMLANPPMDMWPSFAELSADYRTGTGERRSIQPVAGLSVEMNTRTSVARTLGGDGINLVAGEAFVKVDRSKAVQISARDGVVVATRAAFNLRNLGNAVCVSCLDGQVHVRQGTADQVLLAGRELTYSADRFGPVETVDPNSATAWRSGLLIFQGEALSHVIDELNRYRSGRIILTDAALGRRPVNAVFHLDQVDDAVNQIENLLTVRARKLPGSVVLLG